jgi:hypothetical protein
LYNVVIASYQDQATALKMADAANGTFQKSNSHRHAEVLPPPTNSPWWGVYVGQGLGSADARATVKEAKTLGFEKAYPIRAN